MAKRKRSTALFEVISKSKQYRPARPATGRTGSWFSHAAKLFSRPRFVPIVPTDKLPSRPIISAQEMEYDEPPVATAAQEAAFADPVEHDLPEETAHFEAPPPAPARAANQDIPAPPREAKASRLAAVVRRVSDINWTYGTTTIAALGVAFIIGVAVMIGHRLTRTSTPLLAQTTTEELRKGPAHREVLDLPPKRPAAPRVASSEARQAAAKVAPAPVVETHGAMATTGTEAKRSPPFNYVMIQSYPESELKMAEEAAAFLNAKGVPCTVERNIKGYLKVSVVGLDGFLKISSPEFKTYVEHIRKLSGEFSSGSRSFKAFDPRGKKWDKQD